MRKFILITSLVLMSASAHAGQTRGLIVASADPQPSVTEQLKAAGELPATQTAEAKPQAQAAEPKQQVQDSKNQPKAEKPVVRQRETDEQKARRIAARYGISW